jgi:hypothetical protein
VELFILISNEETVQQPPEVGTAIKSPAGLSWLDAISESNMILSAILAVIHPELYEAGQDTFVHLHKHAKFQHADAQHVLNNWTSALSGVAVIRNRIMPLHRDRYSRFHWYDLLVTLGSYQKSILDMPGLGVFLNYGPGTVVGLSGMVLQHAVPKAKGERICYAYFMRNDVHAWAGVTASNWMQTKYYK